jgi:hypothetical protein
MLHPRLHVQVPGDVLACIDAVRELRCRCALFRDESPTALLPRFSVTWSLATKSISPPARGWRPTAVEINLVLDAAGHTRSAVFDRRGDPDAIESWALVPVRW